MTNNIHHYIIIIICLSYLLPGLSIAQEFSTTSNNTQLDDNMRIGWNKSISIRGLMLKFDPFNDVKIQSLNDSLAKFRDLAERIESQDEPDQALIDKIRSVTPSLSDRSFIKSETIATTFWVKLRDKLEKKLKSENNSLKVYKVTNSNEAGNSEQLVTAGEATTEYNIALQWLNEGLDLIKEKGLATITRMGESEQAINSIDQDDNKVQIITQNLRKINNLTGTTINPIDRSIENFSDLTMFEVKFDVKIDENGFSYQPKRIIFGLTFYLNPQAAPENPGDPLQIKERYDEFTESATHALNKGVGLVLDLEDPKTLEFLVTQGIEIGGQKVNKSFYNLIKTLHYEYDIKSENGIVVQDAANFGYKDITTVKNNMRDNYNSIFFEQLYGQSPSWWVDRKGIVTNGLFKIDLPKQEQEEKKVLEEDEEVNSN